MNKLYEIRNTKQIPGEPRRRWFSSQDLDLIVWLGEDENIIGFQLSYDKLFDQRALTVFATQFFHSKVDEGDATPDKFKATPQLVNDDELNGSRLAQIFMNEAQSIDSLIAEHVYENIIRINTSFNNNKLVS